MAVFLFVPIMLQCMSPLLMVWTAIFDRLVGAGDQAPVHSLFQTVYLEFARAPLRSDLSQQGTVGLPLMPRRSRQRIQRNERFRVRAIIFPCWVSGIGRKVSRTPPVTFTH
jgi:hypothetical protein